MILASNQPYFLPYIGYWQLIAASDVFLIGDDYNFIRHGWIHRNRSFNFGTPTYFGITLKHASSFSVINEMEILSLQRDKLMRRMQNEYTHAPFREQGLELLDRVLDTPERNLNAFLTRSIHIVCDTLDIRTPIRHTSELANRDSFRREYRIYDYCHRLGADTYLNPIGGMALYDKVAFREQGLELRFLKSGLPRYRQFGDDFIPSLSILDMLMFNSREDVIRMLDDYALIEGTTCGSGPADR